MNIAYRFSLHIMVLGVLLLTGCAVPAPEPEPGFEVVEYDRYGEIQTAPGVNWSNYSKVQLEKATVTFRKNWARDLEKRDRITIRERDVLRIKSDMSELLDDVLTQELFTKNGFTITAEAGLGVMRVTPRITDLDIYAPDRVRDYVGHTLADSKGNLTLDLDFYDSVSGELLATTSQYQEDPHKGYMERADSPSNRRAFRLMMLRWVEWLHDWLEEARIPGS